MASISKRGRKSHKAGRPAKTLDQLKRLYERQKDKIEASTLTSKSGEVEQWKHCLDIESFNGACYCPQYVISSFGRVWDLDKGENGGIKTVSGNKATRGNRDGYRKVNVPKAGNARNINPNKNAYVHHLVANYFCDLDHEQRSLMIEMGRAKNENDFEVHHISLQKLLGETGDKWDNLQYLGATHHKAIHDLKKANKGNDPKKRERARKRFAQKYGDLFEDGLVAMLLNAYTHETNKHNKLSFTYRRKSDGTVGEFVTTSQRWDKKAKQESSDTDV